MSIRYSLYIIQIILSIALAALALLQTKGSLGGLFGGDGGVYHRRRGIEKTLFRVTIGVSAVFFLNGLATALFV